MKQAPDFTLKDQTDTDRSLHNYRGKWVVLYFYPKDGTSGCTTEACSFRDLNESLLARDAIVIGVSRDSVESHQKFIEDNKLPFTLLSDPHAEVIRLYGAWEPILSKRMTYIIDPDGNVVKEYPKVTPADHATQIMDDLADLQSR
jgi:thioredoxin-dependent peroxiredoxin